MFSLTIVFGPGPMVWTLMFKNEENCNAAFAKWSDKYTTIKDDFGQECTVDPAVAHGWMIENLEQSKLAHIEKALHQARLQAKATEIAESDPVLRAARQRHQTPMLQPMGAMPNLNGRGYPG